MGSYALINSLQYPKYLHIVNKFCRKLKCETIIFRDDSRKARKFSELKRKKREMSKRKLLSSISRCREWLQMFANGDIKGGGERHSPSSTPPLPHNCGLK